MSEQENSNSKILLVVRGLGIAAAINCVIVPLFFTQQQPLFPFPGLYLIEIALSGILGLSGLFLARPDSSFWLAIPWISAGILLAFVILGGFSIGFYLIPATIAFLIGGSLLNHIKNVPQPKFVGLFLVTSILQAAIMIAIVQVG